ncbi:MAG TPA: hypothetical protein VMB77_07305, partial [Syntrophales bacterium]|nr:hypothetical protein [Syntrophales bacterium]
MQKRKAIRSRRISKKASAVSVCPSGESFPLPTESEYRKEHMRLQAIAAKERRRGREIVVVMGLGFVGAVMAGVIADSVDRKTR